MKMTDWTKAFHSNLLDEDNNILWNGIDYTQKSWLELNNAGKKVYLEKDDSTNMLAIDSSMNDLRNEYGEIHFPEDAIKDGKLLQFDDYNSLESYVFNSYNFKTREELEEIGRKEYLKEFMHMISDGNIDDVERTKLSTLAEELGFTLDEVKEIEDDFMFTEKDRISRGIMGFELNERNSKELKEYWNRHLCEIQEACCLHGHPVPVLPEMTEEMAKAICNTIDFSDHNLYADFSDLDTKFWIDSRLDDHYEEKDIVGLLGFADRVVEEWNRDETTVNENRYFDIVKSITESKDYLIPVDVNMKFHIPESVWNKYSSTHTEALSKLYDKVTDTLSQNSELIDSMFDYSQENHVKTFNADWTIRCNIAVRNLDYSSLDYGEITNVLQQQFGTAINKEFGTLDDLNKRVTFSEFKTSVPEAFHTERNRLVVVNKSNYQNYLQTPEEYANSLDLQMLVYAGDTVKDAVARFQNNQRNFNEILEKNPLLKQYAEEMWSPVKSVEKAKTLLCLDSKDISQEEKSSYKTVLDKFYIENIKPQESFAWASSDGLDFNEKFSVQKTESFELSQILYERHDSVEESRKDRKEYPVIQWNYVDKEGNEKTQYMVLKIEREKDSLKIKDYEDISFKNHNLATLSNAFINVSADVTGAKNRDSLNKFVNEGFSIRDLNNRNLTELMLHPEASVMSFFDVLKEKCRENKHEEHVLQEAHKLLKGFSGIERDAIKNYLSKQNLNTEKALFNFLEHKISSERKIGKNISKNYEKER